MLTTSKLIPVVLCGTLFCGQAWAQATVDPQALQQLQPRPAEVPRAPPAAPKPAPKPPVRPSAPPARPVAKPVARPAPVVPPLPPALPSVPPPIVVPVRPPPPPSPVPVVATAPGVAATIPDGRRITFGETGSDLNPATEAAIRAAVRGAPAGPNTTFTVSAFAAGTPEDPSTARRLSLARALAVRGVLIAEGIPSVRIYVKALGSTSPAFADGPADRVDIVASAPEPPPPVPAVAAPTPTAPAPAPAPPASPSARPTRR